MTRRLPARERERAGLVIAAPSLALAVRSRDEHHDFPSRFPPRTAPAKSTCRPRRSPATAGTSSCRKSAWTGRSASRPSSVLLIGAGGLGSPLGLYLAAAGVGRIGLVDFDVVDFSNLQRQVLHGTPDVGRPKLHSARDRLQAINPEVRVDLYETHLTSANALEDPRALRRRHRRHRQLPDALPRQRRLRAAEEAERLRQHLPLRRPGVGVLPRPRPVLSLSLPGAAAAGRSAELRRGRRAGHPAGPDRLHPGDGGGEADPRPRRAADRPAAAVRRPADELPRVQGAPQSEMSDVRRPADDQAADRLRTILRHPRPGSAGPGGRGRPRRRRRSRS